MALRPADHGVAASSAGGVTDFYTKLTETTVSGSSTSTVTLWAQAAWDDYDDLLIVTKTQQTSDTNNRNHRMNMNGTTSQYALSHNGWRTAAGAPQRIYDTSDRYFWMNETCSGTARVNSWSYGQIRIAMHKGANSNAVRPGVLMRMVSQNSDNTVAALGVAGAQYSSMDGGVSRIDIRPESSQAGFLNFKAGSKFTVYGLSMQG